MACSKGCWLDDGPTTRGGYVQRWYLGRHVYVHRAAYEVLVGPIPEGMELDHLCRQRNCYNPAHLEPVTHQENVNRGRGNQWRGVEVCIHGHPFTPENSRWVKNGKGRNCRECDRRHAKERWVRKRMLLQSSGTL